MQASAFQQCSGWRILSSGNFPFIFSWQTGATPARVCVCFVIADVANRSVGIEFLHPRQRELKPPTIVFVPIQGRVPGLRTNRIPTIWEPQFRPTITSIIHELQELGIRNQAGPKLEAPQQNFVARPFVVESKSSAAMTNLVNASFKVYPLQRHTLSRNMRLAHAPRPQRHRPQRILDIGQDEFLMLLLVIQAKLYEWRCIFVCRFQVTQHRLIHVRAVGVNFIQAWSRHQAARTAIGMRSQLLVVGVEKLLVALIERFVTGDVCCKNEGLEKPGRMRKVPFSWAGIRHGLQHVIFCRIGVG